MQDNVKEYLLKYIDLLVSPLDPNYELKIDKSGDEYQINLTTSKEQDVVGENGETLSAVQHLVRVLVHRQLPTDRTHFIIDVNNNKKARSSKVLQQIPQLAEEEVLEKGKTVIIVGLTSYERLQVHKLLQETKGLSTTSVGVRQDRKLIIVPTSEVGSVGMEGAKIVNFRNL